VLVQPGNVLVPIGLLLPGSGGGLSAAAAAAASALLLARGFDVNAAPAPYAPYAGAAPGQSTSPFASVTLPFSSEAPRAGVNPAADQGPRSGSAASSACSVLTPGGGPGELRRGGSLESMRTSRAESCAPSDLSSICEEPSPTGSGGSSSFRSAFDMPSLFHGPAAFGALTGGGFGRVASLPAPLDAAGRTWLEAPRAVGGSLELSGQGTLFAAAQGGGGRPHGSQMVPQPSGERSLPAASRLQRAYSGQAAGWSGGGAGPEPSWAVEGPILAAHDGEHLLPKVRTTVHDWETSCSGRLRGAA
jgi:hypothetical protein